MKAELENLADIIFDPAARRPAQVGMIYPLETLRALTHKDYLETITSPATSDLMPYYAGALFTRRGGVDVLRNGDLENGRLPYRALIAASNLRSTPAAVAALRRYVEQGGTLLAEYGIALRAGQHCAQPLLAELGVTGTLRASFAPYNTKSDVDALVNAVDRALELLVD